MRLNTFAEVVKSWQDHGDISCAKGEIVLKILVAKDEKYQDYFGVTWDMVEKKPKLPKGNLSLATMEKGELVVQEAGGNSGNPKQESFAHEITVSEKGHENNKEAN